MVETLECYIRAYALFCLSLFAAGDRIRPELERGSATMQPMVQIRLCRYCGDWLALASISSCHATWNVRLPHGTTIMPRYLKSASASPCFATAMRKASRRLSQLYDEVLEPSGLRTTQFAILSELERRAKAPPTMRELADAMVMDRSALGHNLRPLERDGVIGPGRGGGSAPAPRGHDGARRGQAPRGQTALADRSRSVRRGVRKGRGRGPAGDAGGPSLCRED